MKLLLVEDNEAIILGLEYLLKEEGFSCQVARTKKEAEKAVSEKSFDLILLDIMLPDGDGYALCEYYPPWEPPVSRFRATRKFLP